MATPQDVTIRLAPVTASNWQACADLDVREDQRPFIPSNLHSIAAAQFYPDNVCCGVYAGEQLVGFTLFGVEQETRRVKLFRLMIASPCQGRGYGAATVRAVLGEVDARWRPPEVYVCHHAANVPAARLYQRFGFREVERSGDQVTRCRSARPVPGW